MIKIINKILFRFGYTISKVKKSHPKKNKFSLMQGENLQIQFAIKKAGLTQRDIAKILNVSDGAVSSAIKNDPLLANVR